MGTSEAKAAITALNGVEKEGVPSPVNEARPKTDGGGVRWWRSMMTCADWTVAVRRKHRFQITVGNTVRQLPTYNFLPMLAPKGSDSDCHLAEAASNHYTLIGRGKETKEN